jgi:hypothetical protein
MSTRFRNVARRRKRPPEHTSFFSGAGRGFTSNGQSLLILRSFAHQQSICRDAAHASVDGVSNAIHRGYSSVADAHAAYVYASARSWTRVISSRPSLPSQTPLATLASPANKSDESNLRHKSNPLHGSESSDDMWYVIYSGVSPGVYRSQ